MAEVRAGMEELISVVVPICNVAPYLDRCVESIVGQTYPNLEILLVDDGSTDGSSAMCDRWAERDSRVKVIHKPHGGQGDARNAGLDAARGVCLAFVDSDDWVDTAMLETLYAAMRDSGAEMAVCGFSKVFPGQKPRKRPQGKRFVLEKAEAMEWLLHYRMPVCTPSCCNKLYRRELWDGLRFPVGCFHEDVCVRGMVYEKCRRVAVTDRVLYYYYQRAGSLMHTRRPEKVMDRLRMRMCEYEYIREHEPQQEAGTNALLVDAVTRTYELRWRYGQPMPEDLDRRLRSLFREHRAGAWEYLPFRQRVEYALFSVSPGFMCVVLRPVGIAARLMGL